MTSLPNSFRAHHRGSSSLHTWLFNLHGCNYVLTTAAFKGVAVAHKVVEGVVTDESIRVRVSETIPTREKVVVTASRKVLTPPKPRPRTGGNFHPDVGYLAADEADPKDILDGQFDGADEKEWRSIVDNEVMERVSPPAGVQPIRCRWRRTWKPLPGGARKAKSRFLVCATNDHRDVETTTHMPAAYVRRALFVYGLSRGWTAATIDVQTAFLLVPLPPDHGDIYVRLPHHMPKFATEQGYRGGEVYKLRKSLYG